MDLPNTDGHSPETRTEPAANGWHELEIRLDALKRLLAVVTLGFVLLALSVNLYLLRQTREVFRRLNEARNVVTHYDQVQKPFIQSFAGSLQNFAKTYTDFQVIVDRYVPQQPVSNAPPTMSAPSIRTPPGR